MLTSTWLFTNLRNAFIRACATDSGDLPCSPIVQKRLMVESGNKISSGCEPDFERDSLNKYYSISSWVTFRLKFDNIDAS